MLGNDVRCVCLHVYKKVLLWQLNGGSSCQKSRARASFFLENVLWREFCNRFLCELRIYSQLFRLQTCLLHAHKDVLIARLARFAGAPQAALDPPGLPKDAKSLFGVSRWDNVFLEQKLKIVKGG